jgi:hypothetical protein
MNPIETIRNRIGDQPKTEIERYVGNGTVKSFTINNKNPYEFFVTINGVQNTAFTYDDEIQKLIFETAPANASTIEIKYKYAAFTDAEIQAVLNESGGDVDRATAESLRQALGSQSRMVSFQHGDRSVSMSDIFKNLMALLNSYEKKISNSGANTGSSFAIGTRTMMDDKPRNCEPNDISRLFM